MNAVIIDDERLARDELRELLKEHKEITVAGAAANVDEALAVVGSTYADLLFLDVQMLGADGFELLERLEPPLPKVVFTTAFAEYAVQAFIVNALDYLLKPIAPERLAESVGRLHEHMVGRENPAARPDSHWFWARRICPFVPVSVGL